MIVVTAGDIINDGTNQSGIGLMASILSGIWIDCVGLGWYSGIIFVLGIFALIQGTILWYRGFKAIDIATGEIGTK